MVNVQHCFEVGFDFYLRLQPNDYKAMGAKDIKIMISSSVNNQA